MFLAQILQESGGLRYKSELNPPANAYDKNPQACSFPPCNESQGRTCLMACMNEQTGSETCSFFHIDGIIGL